MFEAVIAGLLGLAVGSFLNVCIYRMPRDLSVVTPRSHCPFCDRLIAWYDNIPVLSYILLGARCRHCGASIHWRYPAVELLTGALFFYIVTAHGATWEGAKLCAFAAILIDLVFTDLEERILPDEFTLGGAALGVAFAAVTPVPPGAGRLVFPLTWDWRWLSVGEALLGAGVTSAAIWLVGLVYARLRKREGLGFGDVKMLLTIGAFLGLSGALFTLFLGSVVGSLVGLGYIAVTRKDFTYELPFGSFLGLAALLVGLYGASRFSVPGV
jgi:leader peptidase (prepilin peptidase)/N-methyltransferase